MTFNGLFNDLHRNLLPLIILAIALLAAAVSHKGDFRRAVTILACLLVAVFILGLALNVNLLDKTANGLAGLFTNG